MARIASRRKPRRLAAKRRRAQDGLMNAQPVPEEIQAGLIRMGLLAAGTTVAGAPLTGGVSSDIWRIDLPGRTICVKRALPKLRVAADWRAPVSRNAYEAAWMRRAAVAVPGCAPALLGQDESSGCLAMEYLPPEHYPLWKALLRDGVADPAFAAATGATLGRIHAATSADPAVPAAFPTDAIFHDIRLEPYLVASGRAHPDLAAPLAELVATTQANRRALVHGDVSPKNILVGPSGPVFLDAECAWWGDPAFDLAFCLNHLLLKCLWTPAARAGFLACFEALAGQYLARVDWEPPPHLERRAARLLPGLLLARVDGKSPAEYLTADAQKAHVRRAGRALLMQPVERLSEIRRAWQEELGA
jgi:aminoglycoside phosphotransferase (APT) family kinase protein